MRALLSSLAFLVAVAVSQPASAHNWTQNGTDVYLDPTTDNAVIGATSSPGTTYKLDVRGSTYLGGSSSSFTWFDGGSQSFVLDHYYFLDTTGTDNWVRLYTRNDTVDAGLILGTSGADRVYIEPTGNIGIWDADPGYALDVASSTAAKTGGGTWTNPSDHRLKKNIVDLSGGLDAITQLRPVVYEWINPAQHEAGPRAGFLAQEVEQVFPNWVTEGNPKGDDIGLVPENGRIKSLTLPFEFHAHVVQAVKELKADQDSLRAELSAIQSLVCVERPAAPECN